MSEQKDPVNRRATFRRTPRGHPRIECRAGTLGLGANLAKEMRDISQTGAFLVLTKELPIESEVEILLISHGRPKPVKVIGIVQRCQPSSDGGFAINVRFEKNIDYATWQQVT